RDFRHRRQQRQRAASIGDRLVSNARHFAINQLLREGVIRREVEVSEEQLAFTHAWILWRDWLFHFHDHVGGGPNFVSRTDYGRPGALIELVFKAGTRAGVSLNANVMTGIFERAHAGGSQSDSIFVVFNLFGQANNHSLFSGKPSTDYTDYTDY